MNARANNMISKLFYAVQSIVLQLEKRGKDALDVRHAVLPLIWNVFLCNYQIIGIRLEDRLEFL